MDPHPSSADEQALHTRATIGLAVGIVGLAISGSGCLCSPVALLGGVWMLLIPLFLITGLLSGAAILLSRPPGELRMPESPIALGGLITGGLGCLFEAIGGVVSVGFIALMLVFLLVYVAFMLFVALSSGAF